MRISTKPVSSENGGGIENRLPVFTLVVGRDVIPRIRICESSRHQSSSPGARFPLGVKNTFPAVLLGAGLGLHVPPKVSAFAVS